MADVDARHRAKLEARAKGTTPVHVTSPVQVITTSFDNSTDGLYRRKLELRALAQATAASKAEEPESAEEPKAETPDDSKSKNKR